jgi:hypothetical protein
MIFDPENPLPNKFREKPKWLNKFKNTDAKGIRQFLACILIMSFVKLPNLKSYWSSKMPRFSVDAITGLLGRDRFMQLKCCLHLVDPYDLDVDDSLWKIRSFFQEFNDNCRKYYRCGRYVSIDESMLRFSGRSSMTFSKQPKPTPDGFKVIALVDPESGYFYTGLVDEKQKGKPKSEYVIELTEKLPEDNHVVVCDRFYTTINLVESLYVMGHYFIGTIKNTRNIPSIIRKAEAAHKAPFNERRLDK